MKIIPKETSKAPPTFSTSFLFITLKFIYHCFSFQYSDNNPRRILSSEECKSLSDLALRGLRLISHWNAQVMELVSFYPKYTKQYCFYSVDIKFLFFTHFCTAVCLEIKTKWCVK